MALGNIALLLLLGLLAACIRVLGLAVLGLLRLGQRIARHWRTAPAEGSGEALSEALLADPAPLLIAVHGTFAPGADWASPDRGRLHDEIVQALQAADGTTPCWHRHEWGGANTVAARHAGMLALRAQLERVFAAQPGRRVVLIGHSHGGNIALKAAEAYPDRALWVLTLATPFLIAQPRRFSATLVLMLLMLNAMAPALVLGVGCFLALSRLLGPDLEGWAALPALLAAALTLAGALRRGFEHALPRAEADAQQLQASTLDLDRLDGLRARTLVCSRAGDEADGGLKLVSLLNSWLVRTLRSAEPLQVAEQLGRVMLAAVEPGAPPTLATLGRIALGVAWQQRALMRRFLRSIVNTGSLVELFAVWAGLQLLEMMQPAVGTRQALTGAMMAVTSSETPPGEWRHLQSLYALDDDSALLSHSQIYGDAALRAQLCDWICGAVASRPGPQAPASQGFR